MDWGSAFQAKICKGDKKPVLLFKVSRKGEIARARTLKEKIVIEVLIEVS